MLCTFVFPVYFHSLNCLLRNKSYWFWWNLICPFFFFFFFLRIMFFGLVSRKSFPTFTFRPMTVLELIFVYDARCGFQGLVAFAQCSGTAFWKILSPLLKVFEHSFTVSCLCMCGFISGLFALFIDLFFMSIPHSSLLLQFIISFETKYC